LGSGDVGTGDAIADGIAFGGGAVTLPVFEASMSIEMSTVG